ncbi:MAG: hypothetical protein NT031_17515, partial [Planctomycetota bacterium]|nr:hypothetical protein [Planctomycetota bacterium]
MNAPAAPEVEGLSPHNVTVGRRHGRTEIHVDGQAIPGIAYLGPLPAPDEDSAAIAGSVVAQHSNRSQSRITAVQEQAAPKRRRVVV